MRATSHRRWSQRGSSVVEFALTLPILLLVIVAALQVVAVGRAQLQLANAARAAAREAAVDADDSSIAARVAEALPGIDAAAVVTRISRGAGRGDPVDVRLTYRMPLVAPVPAWLLPIAVELHADASMRQEFG